MTIRDIYAYITPLTLTTVDDGDEIVAAQGEGYQNVLPRLVIKNTDTVMRSVTLTDGTTTFATFEIEPKDHLSFAEEEEFRIVAAENAAILATPSANGVLKVAYGRYYKQQVRQ